MEEWCCVGSSFWSMLPHDIPVIHAHLPKISITSGFRIRTANVAQRRWTRSCCALTSASTQGGIRLATLKLDFLPQEHASITLITIAGPKRRNPCLGLRPRTDLANLNYNHGRDVTSLLDESYNRYVQFVVNDAPDSVARQRALAIDKRVDHIYDLLRDVHAQLQHEQHHLRKEVRDFVSATRDENV